MAPLTTGTAGARLRPTFAGASPLAHVDQPTREGAVAVVVGLGAVLVLGMWWVDTAPVTVRGAGGALTAAGRVTGLLGTYLVVMGVLLMGRVAWLDRLIGMDRLAVWHRRIGQYSLSLLVGHGVLTIWGYAVTAHTGVVGETSSVVLSYPDMLAASVGLGLLVAIGVVSARAVRSRVSYQAWYFLHLYAYLALALSFAHQFATGLDFAAHPVNRAAWIFLYAAVGGLLVGYRVVKPVRGYFRHQIRVARVAREAPGVVSVYLTGRRLEQLRAQPGQFFLWRFLTSDGWWQAHPYSLSAAPSSTVLRVTVKALGDHSRDLPQLRPGVRVLAEGPYGAFTADRRRMSRVLLIGAGVGITPLRALVESLPGQAGDITLIYRARSPAEVMFRDELDTLGRARGVRVIFLVGSRAQHPEYLSAAHLRSVVPDIAARDVFVCGPPGLLQGVHAALEGLRVPRRQVHTETFEL